MKDDSTHKDTPGAAHLPLAIHPLLLQPATFPPFDLYVRSRDGDSELGLFHSANEPIYVSTRERLRQQSIEMLYIGGESRERVLDYVEENLPAILRDSAPPGHLAPWLYRLACRAMEALLDDPRSSTKYDRVHRLVGALVGTAGDEPGSTWRMLRSTQTDYHTHSHCINVCVLLSDFGHRLLGVEDGDLLTQLAIGGALHDLGKAMVSPDILGKRSRLDRREFAEVKKHPRYGLGIARPYLRRAPIAQHVILQHHENACGGGYPDERQGESINIFARAARVTDVFDALTSDRPYAGALSYYEALSTMVGEMRAQFDANVLRRFIRYLAAASADAIPVAVPATPTWDEAAGPADEADLASELAIGTPVASARVPAEAEVPAVDSDPDAEDIRVVFTPDLQSRFDPIEALLARQDDSTALMSGIVNAVQGAIDRARRERPQAEPSEGERAATERRARTLPAEAAHVRGLFPVIWELDAWRERLSSCLDGSAATDRTGAEMLAFVGTMREALARFLASHNVEIIQSFESFDATLYRAAAGRPSDSAEPTTGHMRRVGFLYRSGNAAEVLEPPRVVLYPDMRRAG